MEKCRLFLPRSGRRLPGGKVRAGGMLRRLGPCSCAGSGVAPLFVEGGAHQWLVEVQGRMRSPGRLEQPENNTPAGIAGCSMGREGPPL